MKKSLPAKRYLKRGKDLLPLDEKPWSENLESHLQYAGRTIQYCKICSEIEGKEVYHFIKSNIYTRY